jgi:hypothetical protein
MAFFEADSAQNQEIAQKNNESIERMLVILEKTLDVAIANQNEICEIKYQI